MKVHKYVKKDMRRKALFTQPFTPQHEKTSLRKIKKRLKGGTRRQRKLKSKGGPFLRPLKKITITARFIPEQSYGKIAYAQMECNMINFHRDIIETSMEKSVHKIQKDIEHIVLYGTNKQAY